MSKSLSLSLLIAGVDEAGRGPLAGPVYAAAVILKPKVRISGLKDSKLLSALQREKLCAKIQKNSLAYAIGKAEVEEIDQLNIFHASLLAMKRAIESLTLKPEKVLVDGTHCPAIDFPAEAIVKGDQLVPCISAASILAKVMRDSEMMLYDELYPGYGFGQHKGYSTKEHFKAIRQLGLSPIHRKSFNCSLDSLSDSIS